MRADGLTTAKMIQVVSNLFSDRCFKYEHRYLTTKGRYHINEYNDNQRTQELGIKSLVEEGLSKASLVGLLEHYGFRDVNTGIEDGSLLKNYVLELEGIYSDKSVEDESENADNREPREAAE